MEHTPGPWALEAGRTFVTRSGAFYLAYGSDAHTSRPHFNNPSELDANARLIAAAPDLLEALDFITRAARTEPGMAIYAAHLAQAESAIRKATGEA